VDRPKLLIAGGVAAGAAIVLIRRTISKGSRNRLDLQLPVPEDIVIAQSVELTPVRELFHSAFGLGDDELFSYGLYKGKLSLNTYDRLKNECVRDHTHTHTHTHMHARTRTLGSKLPTSHRQTKVPSRPQSMIQASIP